MSSDRCISSRGMGDENHVFENSLSGHIAIRKRVANPVTNFCFSQFPHPSTSVDLPYGDSQQARHPWHSFVR